MPTNINLNYNTTTLFFKEKDLENDYIKYHNESVRLPLRHGIIISLISWYCAIGLIYYVIPEKAYWMVPMTLIYIGSYFGFIIYSTFKPKFSKYYHLLGAISNAWAGIYSIYFCSQFPNGVHFLLPVLIFIMFFGLYMIRLRWIAAVIAATSYVIYFQIHIIYHPSLNNDQVVFYSFIVWMTLVFIFLAGKVVERNNRINFTQTKTIKEQNEIILADKEFLLKEVHHRVKNNLQIILSLINLQLRSDPIESPDSKSDLIDIQSRVLSISTVHQWINQQSNFSMVNLSNLINKMIYNIESLYTTENPKIQVDIDKDIEMDIERSIPFGLLINELFLLNLKLSNSNYLNFNLSIKLENNKFHFTYKDNLERPISDSKLSTDIIETLSDQIDGKLNSVHNTGNVVSIQIDSNHSKEL